MLRRNGRVQANKQMRSHGQENRCESDISDKGIIVTRFTEQRLAEALLQGGT
ncbi:hypothetical protein [Acidovorax sp. SUPP3434]|uniref:hypothetical protein n=1 Tax=Acidovorax sp. SUPP3434 TaxID=2920880 RepID=UPI0024E15839|nr:hypothetical protein [Acidovorax sp. SUPP3434]